MGFDVAEFYKYIDSARFSHHGFYCKHCGSEIYVLNLGNGFCAIRCKSEAGFHIVRADNVFEAERLYGNRLGACSSVEGFR